jgi:hypothetical protein
MSSYTFAQDPVLDPSMTDAFASRGASHPNPMFDFLTGFVPRKLKDLFKWAEYLVFNSAQVYAVVKKFGEYPITKIKFDTAVEGVLLNHKRVFEVLRVRGFLTQASFDKFIYGNGFYSFYKPFKRMLECRKCKARKDINYINYKYKHKDLSFHYTCHNCHAPTTGRVVDMRLKDLSRMRIIRWDPKMIDIEYNPITGDRTYFYTIPKSLKEAVEKGQKSIINTLPMGFLRAIKENKLFRFDEGALYHMKVPGPAGVESQWGFPPVTSAIKLFLFTAVLRKANEAIALDYVAPMRILSPKINSPNADPFVTISLSKWRSELEKAIRLWRRDPLHMLFAPIPTEVTHVGGEGRTLMVSGEIKDANNDIIMSMGVPVEFVTGGLTAARGEISLRMLENQLQTHIEDLNDLLQWIESESSNALDQPAIPVSLTDFKLIDDVERKQLLLQLWSQGKVSDSTVAEMFEVDLVTERRRILEDALAQEKSRLDIEARLMKLRNSLSQRAQQLAQSSNTGRTYDQQVVISDADNMVQEMLQYDPGTRRSRLEELKGEDYVMYSVVIQRLEQAHTDQEAQARQQPAGGPPPM